MKTELPSSLTQFICRYLKAIIVCLLPILGALGFYICYLGSWEFSSKPDVWGQFGDFLNFSVTLSLGIGNLFLLYLLTTVANTMDSKNLEKELAFDIYKSFISNIDEYSINYFAIITDDNDNLIEKKKQVKLASIHYLIESAKVNFSVLLSENDYKTFTNLASDLIKEIEEKFDNSRDRDFSKMSNLISEIKKLIFKQIKS